MACLVIGAWGPAGSVSTLKISVADIPFLTGARVSALVAFTTTWGVTNLLSLTLHTWVGWESYGGYFLARSTTASNSSGSILAVARTSLGEASERAESPLLYSALAVSHAVCSAPLSDGAATNPSSS